MISVLIFFSGCKKFPDVSDVISKVRFFIHQTYAPNNVIDVAHPPYHLIRRGWGEFPARVQIHFKEPVNKPVDIMHNIKVSKLFYGIFSQEILNNSALLSDSFKTLHFISVG